MDEVRLLEIERDAESWLTEFAAESPNGPVEDDLMKTSEYVAELVAEVRRQRGALKEILKHGGKNEYDDCSLRPEHSHGSCRPVIFRIARAALSADDVHHSLTTSDPED